MILSRPLIPRNPDGILRLVTVGRISRPEQDPESMNSMHFDDERWLKGNFDGTYEVRRFSEQASGWLADRATMLEVEALVEAGQIDLVLVSEVREIYRNPALLWRFILNCVDAEVRFISIFDHVDTGSEDWETNAHVATLRHGMTVPEARRRVRRKADYMFSRGGMVLKIRFGYRKLTLQESESGDFGTVGLRVMRLSEWTAIIREIRQRLVDGDSPDTVAEWLNDQGIPVGPYVTTKRWRGKLVSALMKDPILSGARHFRSYIYKQIYKTGKHRRQPNQQNAESKAWPELAHITVEEQEEVVQALKSRRLYKNVVNGRDHPCWNRPRSRSYWPRQHARCSACKGLMYATGKYLKCAKTLSNSDKNCWNHVQVPIRSIRDMILPWVLRVLNEQPHWRERVVELAWQESQSQIKRRHNNTSDLDRRIADRKKERSNLVRAIKHGERIPALVKELTVVEESLNKDLAEKKRLECSTNPDEITTREEISDRLDQVIMNLSTTSYAFADLLRRLLPVFEIRPVQQLDRPQARPRAHVEMRLDAWSQGNAEPFSASMDFDLFEPAEYIKNANVCWEMRQKGMSVKQVAEALNLSEMAVKRACRYRRLMDKLGMTTPYREISGPEDVSRWKKRPPRLQE